MKLFEWLFKYSPADYQHGQLVFASGWSLKWLLVAWLLGAAVLLALLARRGRLLNTARTVAIGALQLAMWTVILLIVWQPALLVKSLRTGENGVALMLDTSASMALFDGGSTRMQQAQAVLGSDALQSLQKDYEFRRYAFAGNAGKLDSFDKLPSPEPQTSIGASLVQVLQQSRTSPLGAVVLVSDGDENAGGLDQNQLAQIASFGVPVHTIGIGREQIPEDLELDGVLMPTKTLPGTTVSARLAIRHDGPGVAHVKVADGDKLLAARDVQLPADSTVTTAWLDLNASDSGDRELKFVVDGKPGEPELRNNTQTRMLQVAADPAPILYVEGEPRWDYKFMRRALDKDDSLRLLSLLRTTTNGLYRQGVETADELKNGFPTDKETLFRYEALVIGNMQAAWFSAKQQQLIADFVSERGGTLLMLGGSKGLGEGGWQNTVVNDLLPAHLLANGASFHRVQAPVSLTPAGRRSQLLKFSDNAAENDKQWASLPALADYQDLGALKPAAARLLSVKLKDHEQPLLVSQNYGRGHVYILATGGTWRWRMSLPLDDHRHEAFWRQLARGLVADVPKQLELSAETRGEQINLRAEVRNKAFEPQKDAAVVANATTSTGERTRIELKPVLDQPGVYQADYKPSASGAIFFETQAAVQGGKELLGTARTATYYEQGRAEYFSLRQNRGLLERLAAATGGQYFVANALDTLPEAIRFSPAGVTQTESRPLWDMPVLFVLLFALKAIEWLLRRRWRIV